MKTKARHLSAVLATGAIIVGLGACSSDPSPEEQAQGAVQAFLDELAAGNASAALDLTTSSRGDFACPVLTDDTEDGLLVNPAAGEASVDGDTATVDAEYFATPDGPTELTFTVERASDEWLVVLPDAYQIALEFDAPTIAEVDITRVTGDDGPQGECHITASDANAHTLALPGTYLLNITDTSGVFAGRTMTTEVSGTFVPVEPPAISPESFDFLSTNVSMELRNMFVECVLNDFEPVDTCPEGTEGITIAGDPVEFSDSFLESEAFALEQVWTEDERTWLFTTEPVTFDAVRDGEDVTLEVSHSGQLADNDGELEITLD